MSIILCRHCAAPVNNAPSRVGTLALKHCSFACRSAAARSIRKTRAQECGDLLRAGKTRKEVAAGLGVSISTLYQLLAEFGVKAPRLQTQKRERHPSWKGNDAGYGALHLRVVAERGKAAACAVCGKSGCRIDYANLTGRLTDTSDYAGMCRSCHTRFDSARKLLKHVHVLAGAVGKVPGLPATYIAGLLVEAGAAIAAALGALGSRRAA